jgi:hypothetical protein
LASDIVSLGAGEQVLLYDIALVLLENVSWYPALAAVSRFLRYVGLVAEEPESAARAQVSAFV